MTNPFGTFLTDQVDTGGTGGGGSSGGGGTAGGGGNSNICPFPDTFLRCSQTSGIGIFATGDADSSGRCTEYSALASICNAPPPSPSSTPKPAGCTLGGNDCPPGYVCVIKESFSGGAGIAAVPTYTAICEPVPSPSPNVSPPPSPTPENTRAKIRCCGPLTAFVCTDVAGTSCPRGTAECDVAGLSCAPPPTSPAVSPPPTPTPTPVECPSDGTFIRCEGTNAVRYRGDKNADGTCATILTANDPQCPPPPSVTPSPTPQVSVTPSPTPQVQVSVTPSPTPPSTLPPGVSPSRTPIPSLTPAPSRTPDPTIAPPPVSPFVSQTPLPSPEVSRTPVPSPSPITWRDCVSGTLNIGTAPSGYREVSYPRGGTCWEPVSDLGFTPSLSDALLFVHERGGPLPSSKRITATNPSYGKSYRVTLASDENIIITPNNFIVPPRQNIEFVVAITYGLIDILGDGSSTLRMDVTIAEI